MIFRLDKLGKWSAKFTESWKAELPELPAWTRSCPQVRHWAYEDMPFRAKVMSCKKSERGEIILEAQRLSRRAGLTIKPGGNHGNPKHHSGGE